MGNLIKPAEYAKKMGISRQAVYAKIKKGILTSKSVEGKLYIVQNGAEMASPSATARGDATSNQPHSRTQTTPPSKDFHDLLDAKDETIGILKETIVDLKETNKMITSTLRGEVDLLKEAFSEMKMLYSTRIEHLQTEEPSSVEVENISEEFEMEIVETATEERTDEAYDGSDIGDDLAWIELSDFFDEHDVRKQSKQTKISKLLKKLFKKGDSRVDSFNGELIVLADADYSDLFKKKKKG
jgi:hypothetical protein